MKKKIELCDDVVEEDPSNFKNKKEEKKYWRKLEKSVGWLEPELEYFVKCDEKGKTWTGAEKIQKIVYEVSTGNGSGITVDDEIQARILALILQINERLKRVEQEIRLKSTLLEPFKPHKQKKKKR